MKPRYVWDGNVVGPRVLRMPVLLSSIALGLFQLGAPVWLTNGLVGLAGFLGSGLGQLALAAGAYGLNLLLQKKPTAPQPADVQTNIRQEISPRRRVYGRALVGSVIVFGFRRGEKSYLLHYICEGPIGGIVSYRLDKKPVTLDVNGFVQEDQYIVDGRSRVQILTSPGTMADEPFAELIEAFPELDTPLTPFRHRGCVMALEIVEQVPVEDLQDTYPNNMPALQLVIDGYSRVYDSRTGTYGFADNAGACLLTESMDVYGFTDASTDDVNFASWAAFCDHCDEDVPLKAGGTEKRYRAGGVITLDGENEARVLTLATICNADVYLDPQGRLAVREKMRSTPGIALRAKNGDHLDIQIESGRGLQKQFNVAKVSYVEPALNYKANEVRWAALDLMDEDGTEYPQPITATLCPSATQAMRIGKLAVFEGNPDFAGSVTSGPQALDLMEEYVFTLDLSPEDDFVRVACSNAGIEYDGNAMTVSAPFVIYRDGATDWNPAVDEQDQVIVPPDLPSNVGDILLDVTVTVEILSNSAPILKFSWVASGSGELPDSYSHQLEVSPADTEEWTPAAVTQKDDTAKFGPVADGAAYDWRIRNIASGKTFDWQYSVTPVTVTLVTTPPKALAGFAEASVGQPHYGVAPFTITTKSDPLLAGIALYRTPSGGVFNAATDLISSFAALPGITFTYTQGEAPTFFTTNGDFALAGPPPTLGNNCSISGGKGLHSSGSAGAFTWPTGTLPAGAIVRYGGTIDSISGASASLTWRLVGGTTVSGTVDTTAGFKSGFLTSVAGNTNFAPIASTNAVLQIDNINAFIQTADQEPRGTWDYRAAALNRSGKAGPVSGPVTITVI